MLAIIFCKMEYSSVALLLGWFNNNESHLRCKLYFKNWIYIERLCKLKLRCLKIDLLFKKEKLFFKYKIFTKIKYSTVIITEIILKLNNIINIKNIYNVSDVWNNKLYLISIEIDCLHTTIWIKTSILASQKCKKKHVT